MIIGSKPCEYSETICTGCETATVEAGTCASGGSDSIACRTGYSRSPAAAVICGDFKIICGSLQGSAALILLENMECAFAAAVLYRLGERGLSLGYGEGMLCIIKNIAFRNRELLIIVVRPIGNI